MKAEGVLVVGNSIGVNRYSLLVSNVLSYDFNIPAGARVTVEWDGDPISLPDSCPKMDEGLA